MPFNFKHFIKQLGPGLVTGASDDDPSGIATYSQAGAQFGTGLLWTAVATLPFMIVIQEMCARIGLVTGKGLTGVIKLNYPKSILYPLLLLSFVSIVFNIGADIAAIGAVGQLLIPSANAMMISTGFTVLLAWALVVWSYERISKYLKLMCISLFCYLIIPFIHDTNWTQALLDTIWPNIQFTGAYCLALVAILGTTISPYLFFWQTSMEVEEMALHHIVVDKQIIRDAETDVMGGLSLANLVFYFIILTTGTVLFNSGIHQINTVEDAAKALEPLGGKSAYILFSIGVIGTGALAVPVLAGALSYMFSEVFDWEEGLNRKFVDAKGFYLTLIISMFAGLAIHVFGLSPIKMLFYSAVLYGLVAPFMILILLKICNDKSIMGKYVNTRRQNVIGVLTLVLMVAAIVGMTVWR